MLENFLLEAINNGITSTTELLTALQSHQCDNWPSYRAYVRMEASAFKARNVRGILGKKR